MTHNKNEIDLRSDTVTQPTPAMRKAMHDAVVGDDVLGDDPTVIDLQQLAAELLGKQAAVFVPSGSMANLCAISAQTNHGDEIIANDQSHFFFYETGGFAAIAGCSIRGLPGQRGFFTTDQLKSAVRPDQIHFPRTSLVVLENTHNRGGGSIWPMDQFKSVASMAHDLGLRVHLDGARLMNACVALGVAPSEITQHVDSVSMCFSKGLGAPVGSVMASDNATIESAMRYRKMFGGTMRQSGILAAAALHALDHHVDRLAEDHENARRFAGAIASIPGISIDPDSVETNMVFFDIDQAWGTGMQLAGKLSAAGLRMFATSPQRLRAVFHLDVTAEQTDRAAEILHSVVAPQPA
jgi:threonine aldolase